MQHRKFSTEKITIAGLNIYFSDNVPLKLEKYSTYEKQLFLKYKRSEILKVHKT